MLEVNNLYFDYSDKRLLHDINFIVQPGSLLHLCGGNGVGKTTLLKLLAGMLQPEAGDILFKRQSIYDDVASYQQCLCYVGHKSGINALLTVRENCYFDLKRSPTRSCDALIQAFGLSGLEGTRCGWLSAGQQRRVGLLRLLLSNTQLWLLDEPLVALDNKAVAILMSCLSRHLEEGGMVILSSHQPLMLLDRPSQEYQL